MEKSREIMCDCGGKFHAQEHDFQKISTLALVCEKCGNVTLSKEQAKKLLQLKEAQTILKGDRKIIRIGNSLGITLPDGLRSIGIHPGQRVRITPLGTKSFKIAVGG